MKTSKTVLPPLPYFRGTREEALFLIRQWGGHGGTVFTPNAEIAYHAAHSRVFYKLLSEADILLPDGVGVTLAASLRGEKLFRIPGVEFAEALVARRRVYFIGGEGDVAEKAAKNLKKRYPSMEIAGYRHGYFPFGETKKVIEHIAVTSPEVVLVALGSPRQELFARVLRERLPNALCMAVGGSLDIYAGRKKRAPRIFRLLGLEWLCRVLCEPKRLPRLRVLPLFFIESLRFLFKKRENAHLSKEKSTMNEEKLQN